MICHLCSSPTSCPHIILIPNKYFSCIYRMPMLYPQQCLPYSKILYHGFDKHDFNDGLDPSDTESALCRLLQSYIGDMCTFVNVEVNALVNSSDLNCITNMCFCQYIRWYSHFLIILQTILLVLRVEYGAMTHHSLSAKILGTSTLSSDIIVEIMILSLTILCIQQIISI
jgi:hypothetical protein